MGLLRLLPRRMLPRTPEGDLEFCRRRFVRKHGRSPEPDKPTRFTDHLYRIKTNGTLFNPLIARVTDKEHVKAYVESLLGPGHTPGTLAVLRSAGEAQAFVPDRAPCVLKPSHLSGQVMFHRRPEAPIDRALLRRWLRSNLYRRMREGNYLDLVPKVIVEEFLSEDGATAPKDYKLYCFNGEPKLIQVDSDRFGKHTQNFYDSDWIRLPMTFGEPSGDQDDERPPLLDAMLGAAATLAQPFRFVRVDLYATDGRLSVGELTFCPRSGLSAIFPAAADFELAKLFDRDYWLDAQACAKAWADS